MNNIDRSHASRLLAKCAAYVECGKRETARKYALELMAYLGECIDGPTATATAPSLPTTSEPALGEAGAA